MDIQNSTNRIPSTVRTQRPWYISDDRMTVTIRLPKEIVWARLSEELRRVIVQKQSFFAPLVKFSGRMDGENLEVCCSTGGRTGTRHAVTGELASTREGTELSLSIHENRIVRLGHSALGLLCMILLYAFLTGFGVSFFSTGNFESTLIFAAIVSIPSLLSTGWQREKALTRTADLLKSIAEGRYYEAA